MKEATQKVIIKIKEVKKLKGLSNQDIVDICEENNDTISTSTVRRMLAKGSEYGPDFRQYSVNAVFRAVVGTKDIILTEEEEADLSAVEKETIAENAALRAVVELRDKTIAAMEDQIKTLQQEKAAIKDELDTAYIKLETTNYLFKLAMESIGKGSL